MDSQVLPLPMFSHQMASHRMNVYDPAPIHRTYQQPVADRSERRQNGSISSYSTRVNSHSSSSNYLPPARTAERSQSPTPSANSSRRTGESQRQQSVSNDTILPHLQIPASINASGGSLAEFAAQICCLFWFETSETLKIAERSPSSPSIRPLVREAIPAVGFRKWVVTILSTTQVTQNVILLALLFIYRLKNHNPTVKGKVGSEYRLLTVALMLGNKFLDDNTYTNKTWAEVSGISVQEIHIMEVEFLSNMRYSLLASEEQWKEWKMKLSNFYDYFDRASRIHSLPSPSGYRSPLLLSPPVSMQSSPPHLSGRPQPSNLFTQTSQYTAPPISPLPSMPDLDLRPASRKRSYDDTYEERPTKRIAQQQPPLVTPVQSSRMSNRQNLPRLPMPSLTIPPREPMHPVSGNYSAQNGTVLPPLNGRSMSSVYPTTPGYTQQPPLLTPTGSQAPSHSTFNTPSRHHSPRSLQDLLSVGSSPMSASFPRGPNSSFGHNNSPSIFYQQRSSPYKPVRHVNTLLHPPPHASTQGVPAGNLAPRQMHYQPLGKRNDFRTGILPEFQGHSGYAQWPGYGQGLPQPNFRG